MKQILHQYLSCLLPAAKKWWRDRHADDAAALAFYSLISLVPLLLVSVYLASFIVDEQHAKEIVISEANRVAGKSIGEYFASMLHGKITTEAAKYSSILGGLLLLFSSTKMISELRKSLAKVFGKSQRPKKVFSTVVSRLVSVAMVIMLGMVIISAVAVESILSILHKAATDTSLMGDVISWLSPLASFAGVALLAAITMRWLPEQRPKLKNAIAGGILSAFLLFVLKFCVTQTLAHTDIGSYYGSAFTLVLVLFWIYFTMQVFLYGAEYAAELGNRSWSAQHAEAADNLSSDDEPLELETTNGDSRENKVN